MNLQSRHKSFIPIWRLVMKALLICAMLYCVAPTQTASGASLSDVLGSLQERLHDSSLKMTAFLDSLNRIEELPEGMQRISISSEIEVRENASSEPRPATVDIAGIIQEKSQEKGLDPKLVVAVVATESEFNPKAVSKKGAKGLMQLMPMHCKGIDPFDPEQNLDKGTELLAKHLADFNGNLKKALIAYNAGPDDARRRRPPSDAVDYANKVMGEYRRLVAET